MNGKRQLWLALAFMGIFAITRWPGLMPPNFSATYALMFCAGVYFRQRAGWWVPLVLVAITDLLLNCYWTFGKGYDAFQWYQLLNYPAYAALIWLGRRFNPQASVFRLVCGSLLGAILFYIITNTAAWLFNPFGNPEYTKTLFGWIIALTKGTSGWPQALEFFRNTLLSSGLFTALFASAMKYSQHLESAAEKKAAEASANADDSEAPADAEEANA